MKRVQVAGGKAARSASSNLTNIWRASGAVSSAALAWAIGGSSAEAQCAPDPAPAGANVVCRGTDTNGFRATGNNIAVTVEVGATVQETPGQTTLFLNSPGGQFTNRGTISRNSGLFFDPAVQLMGGLASSKNFLTGTNFGTITSNTSGLNLRGLIKFENAGSIQASIEGVQLDQGFAGTFTNSGTISTQGSTALDIFTSSSAGTAVRTSIVNTTTGQIRSSSGYGINMFGGDIFDITNSGLIRGGVVGIGLKGNSSLTNSAGGIVEATTNVAAAIVVASNFNEPAAVITNAGTIKGVDVAISGGFYALTNSGDIQGNLAGAAAVVNAGRVSGAVSLGANNDSFENSGTVTSTINLGDGADIFRDFGGSIGAVDLGAGDDFLLTKSGTARASIVGGITPGLGLDSFGLSIEGKETVSLAPAAGFEGLALEARYATSEATLAAGASPLTQTLSVMGDGAVINRSDINVAAGDAVRFYSNTRSGLGAGILLPGSFGNGVTFINEGTITAAPSGFAVHSIGPPLTGSLTSSGNERVDNRGQITGRVMLDAGNDTLINSGQITGDVILGFSTSQGFDDNLLINSGRINGNVLFAMGSDRVINSGQITGAVDLVFGDDTYLVDLDASGVVSAGAVNAGPGFDVFGVRTARTASISQGVATGFEGLGVMVDGKAAQVTITAPPAGQTLPYLRIFGSGTVINNADILNSNPSPFVILPTVAVVDDGATFINNGVLSGFQALSMAGSGLSVTNNANLQRGAVGGDSTGNTGVIQDRGIGNTLVNNGNIDVTVFSTSAVFIGLDTFKRFGSGTNTSAAPITRFVNNGQLNSTTEFGLRLQTNYAVDILNTGRIDDIGFMRSESGIAIRNGATGSIGAIAPNGLFSSDASQGSVTLINDGIVGDLATTQLIFRDLASPPAGAGYADAIVNSGTLRGVVQMNTGADTFVMKNAGVLQGTVDGGADFDTLGFDGVSGAIRASQFSNFERLDIATPGVAVLDANSGLSSSLKELIVRGGLVRADTNVAMNVNVLAGGALGGNGAITGDVTVNGVLTPGASVGMLTINGNLTLGPQSATMIEFDASGNDRIIVNGAAQLGGALRVQSAAHPTRIRTLTFMSVSGATTGAFSSIAYDVPGGFSGLTKLIQDASGQISVQITPQLGTSATASAGAAVAGGYFNRVILGGQGGATSDQILTQLFALGGSSANQAFALETLGPTTYAATPWLGSRQALSLTDIVRPRLLTGGAAEPGVTAWLSASQASSSAKTRADVGAAGFKASATPIVAGVEYSGRGMIAGAFAGSIDGKQTLILGRGATKADGLTAGVYAGFRKGPAHAGLTGAYVDGEAKSIRGVPFLGQVATSEFGLKTWVAQANTAYDFDYDVLRLTPAIGVTFAHVTREAVSETGTAAALNVPEASEDFLHIDAGIQAMAKFEVSSNFTLRPSLWLGRRLELAGASPTAHGALSGTSDNGLIAWSATPVRSRLTARLGLEGEFSDRLSGFVRYEGEFGRRESDDAISAGLSLRF